MSIIAGLICSIVIGPAGEVIPMIPPAFRYGGILYRTSSSSAIAAIVFLNGIVEAAANAVEAKKCLRSIFTNYISGGVNNNDAPNLHKNLQIE